VIRFSVWDKDPTESEMIGQIVEKFNKLDRLPGCATDVQWYNMYGAPEFKNEKLLSNLKKGAMAVAKAAQQTFAGEIDWAVSSWEVCGGILCGVMFGQHCSDDWKVRIAA
jgi:hypothetical protein